MRLSFNNIIKILMPRFSCVIDELTFNASDNDNTPESPILQPAERKKQTTVV